MDVWRIAVRAVVAFGYLNALARLSGHRIVRQATPFDFLVALIVGDLIDDCLWAEVSMSKFAVAAATIFLLDLIMKTASFHSPRFFLFMNGGPTVVVRNGTPQPDELRREQLNDEDLASLLRRKGFASCADVELAVLDRDRDLSVILEPEARPATRRDLA
jgi:uncharacterized membrane protein YcaP (DUF421 family)